MLRHKLSLYRRNIGNQTHMLLKICTEIIKVLELFFFSDQLFAVVILTLHNTLLVIEKNINNHDNGKQ